jgi:biopolymer transport protein ExbB/TolQ
LGEIMSDVATTAPPIAARSNGKVYWIAAGLTFLFVIIGSFVISKDTGLAVFLFDHSSKSFFSPIYPVTIQNGLYLMFGLGVADLWVRYQAANREQTYIDMRLLPEADEAVLQIDQLGPIRRKIVALNAPEDSFLPQLIDQSILQLVTSKSVEQTVTIYTSMLELITHRLDLAYQTLRYLVWIIPTTGFIGTVIGIAIALEGLVDPKKIDVEKVTSGLAVAFYTTILALALSAVLVLLQNIVQRKEESALNRAAQYCLKNLINRVYTGG